MSYVLDYGALKVIVSPMPVRSVSVGIFVGTGSGKETLFNNGISHFTEHMLFKGTKTKSAFDIANEMDCIGADMNAYTSKTHTCYYAVSLDAHVEKCFSTLCDLYFNAVCNPSDVEKERGVVLEEINMTEDDPDDLAFELCALAKYSGTPYAMPILGSTGNVGAFGQNSVLDYIGSHYVSQNTVVTFVGNVTEEQVDVLIRRHFLPYERKNALPRGLTGEYPVSDRFVTKIKDVEQVNVVMGFDGYPYANANGAAASIVTNVLGGGMSSRLFQRVREELGLVYSVYSTRSSYADVGSVAVYFGTGPKTALAAGLAVEAVVNELFDKGMTEEELKKGVEQIKSALVIGQESTKTMMKTLGTHFLYTGKLFSVDDRLAELSGVTLADVKRVGEHIFNSATVCGSYVGRESDFTFDKVFKG